ncbi:hypothetical protein ALNOE001_08770 [Candidatus Methanobinarius endosymbioticus]|uniref:Right handed beta helix domain-containing protein n=1 Tax=Candidatus Methanobinarius endosymbioticus TaxID=2006182 RepID=A0A366MDH8_9EURY|nr:hypothetical protein ALNOE001_08770 [Candidatus Methanobinarius endosymbioticus]
MKKLKLIFPNVNISGFYFENYYNGVCSNSSKTTITNNTFVKNGYGIFIEPSMCYNRVNLTDTIIVNNIVNNNTCGGIRVSDILNASNINISRNLVTNNFGSGISIRVSIINNGIITDNIVNNHNYTSVSGIYSSNLTINNNVINNRWNGISIYINYFENSTVMNNTANNNKGLGIYISGYPNIKNNISNNIAKNNLENDIYLTVDGDGYLGFIINNTIKNNDINNNINGLVLYAAGWTYNMTLLSLVNNNIIEKNNITNHNGSGIFFDIYYGSVDNTTIKNNIIHDNEMEIVNSNLYGGFTI